MRLMPCKLRKQTPPTGDTTTDAANQVGGINLSLSIGTSKNSSKTTQTSSTAQSSTLNAGGDITIVASGAGQDSDINIIGSQVKANDDVTLKADNQINLLAAQNTNTLDGKNKSSSASVGVSVGTTSGLAVTASASQGKGKTTGNGTSWTETIIQSGNQDGKVTLQSGTDTTIKGAQVAGNQVIANVGTSGQGNLNIESLQDTDQYQDKQKSAGISVSIPIGAGSYGGSISASNSNTQSNYASVNEQSGIMAGDGGFQVNVNGNTNLTGAVIASTEQAIQNNVNSLTTQTLTTSNIENSAEYSAKGISFSAGVGLNQQPDGTGYKNTPTASAGSANLSDDSNSVTVSGISGGTVNITDTTTQQTNTGKGTATTLATLNRDVQTQFITDAQGNTSAMAVDSQGNNLAGTLTPIFDKEQIQRELNAQIQITQAFSQVAPKAVGDYATNKFNELKTTNPEEAKKWDEGGIYRIALHTALGGLLTGDLSGVAGAGVVASAAPLLNDLQSKVTEALQNAGLGEQGANTISQALAELTSLGIGSAIGGTAGAGTALVVDTNNRQLHFNEQLALDKLKAGKTKEEQRRLDAAACALVLCADGLSDLNPAKADKLKLQNEGMQYFTEQQQLIQASNYAFYYSSTDARNDSYRALGLVQNIEGLWSPPVRSPYPDYLSVNANVYVASGGVSLNMHSLDLYGQWSLGHAYGGGNPYPSSPGFSFLAGYITSSGNTSYLTESFLQGGSLATNITVPTVYVPLVGATVGVNHSYGGATATEFGVSFPIIKPTGTISPSGYGFKIGQ